jgi:hypothetical protein
VSDSTLGDRFRVVGGAAGSAGTVAGGSS